MNEYFSFFYCSGFWVKSSKGNRAHSKLFFFLGAYQRLALLCLQAGKNRYQIIPKLHYLSHFALEMRDQASKSDWVVNPLATSVQTQEDFVGRPSRVSRRVDIRRLHKNVISRCLILANRALEVSDVDQRGMDAYER